MKIENNMMKNFPLAEFIATQNRIRPYIIETPLVLADSLSELLGTSIYFKLETAQHTGAFKVRGASSAMLRLSAEEQKKGVSTYSTGNCGRGVSYMGKKLGVPVTVYLSELVPANKIKNIERLGGKICVFGKSQDTAQLEAEKVEREQGIKIIAPFDSKEVILGQGTIGLEIIRALPNVGTVMIPLSGGGLLSGIACCIKQFKPDVEVIGISMEKGAAMIESIRANKPVQVEEYPSLADSLGGGIGLQNKYTFELTKKYADQLITTTEKEIADAMKTIFHKEQLVCEGASAVSLAALKSGKCKIKKEPVVMIISGKNVDMDKFLSLVN